MSEQYALIYRRPNGKRSYHSPYDRTDPFDTIVLARGSWEAMQTRWRMADKRLRAFNLAGHVEVRGDDDPKVPHDRYWDPSTTPEAWLAIMTFDRVVVRIYGNTYGARVMRAGVKSVDARFSAATRKGGWGGEPALRTRTFPLSGGNRGVERVIELVPVP